MAEMLETALWLPVSFLAASMLRDVTRMNPLWRFGHLEVVEKLLTAGADANAAAAGGDGRTALQAAAEGGHLEIINRLKAAGALSNLNTMLLPEEILAESFVDEKELVAKILLGVREREGGGASDARLKTRKRHESYNRDGSAM
ncbi:uncharacterized protein VDAG_04917 [Verticillium dahliae VdLs.17]|uniref:Uncharacterized protein n=1 Tax=Verticillium dahliae (strain VdLs.17 / ATCC MYA-4575 / FGSC 10137) TaxID=498257 RepID=G2X3D2_VERDV|nr:uncharacterized protein VDAG_04917 [Verticillium dahliae VdLs.17]EGY23479.1 hypothetical protein VDAG_04917 [Verticillium dahliae VdLs.17]KAH6708499.1 hypothetical protein EV126DRAFT_377077 [Verticillium dahliae]